MPDPVIERLIQRQINQWSRIRELLAAAKDPSQLRPLPTITISRQLGAGARQLAANLAKRLDLQVYGHEIIERIAQDAHLSRDIVAQLDERVVSGIDAWVRGMLNQRMFVQDDYHYELVKTIHTLAAHGGVVILGRGANLILEDRADLRLRVVASDAVRIANLQRYEAIDADEARQRMDASDSARDGFVRKLFHRDVDDPLQYDLILVTDRIDGEGLVDIVLEALASRRANAAAAR